MHSYIATMRYISNQRLQSNSTVQTYLLIIVLGIGKIKGVRNGTVPINSVRPISLKREHDVLGIHVG